MFDTRKQTCPNRQRRARQRPLLLLALVTPVLWSVASGVFAGTFEGEEDVGRQILLEAKCQRCHAVSTAEVAMDDGARKPGPDLAKLSPQLRVHKGLDAYLRRTESKGGKRHPVPWRGEDDGLDQLVKWLLLHQAGDTAALDQEAEDIEPGTSHLEDGTP